MPELPEVETTRRGILPARGAVVAGVELRLPAIVTGPADPPALLTGAQLLSMQRHGKELLIGAQNATHQPALMVHLGMTGALRLYASQEAAPLRKHTHVIWTLADGRRLEFHDPRRFGGIWTFASPQAARQARWAKLGEDALRIDAPTLYTRLHRTRRALKAALLDQTVIAGLGNIYVDELLFRAKVHPGLPAHRISAATVDRLIPLMRDLLRRAIRAKGSSVRDYRDGRGRRGRFQFQHKVYGRSGQACLVCACPLRTTQLGGRTTVLCPNCQKR